MKQQVKQFLRYLYLKQTYKRRVEFATKITSKHNLDQLKATEVEQIKDLWGDLASNIFLPTYALYKKDNGFDARFLSHEIYAPMIERALNPCKNVFFASNKSLAPALYSELKQPKTIIRKINFAFFDTNNQLVSSHTAVKQLCSYDGPDVIVKDSSETYGGFGVKKISLLDMSKEQKQTFFDNIINNTKTDFIIQQTVTQHPQTAKFNQSSLNCFRVTTLFINGKVSVCGSQFKSGLNGAQVDNIAIGGGVIFKANDDGSLSDFAYDKDFNKIYISPDGVEFKGHKIDDFPKILDAVLKYHPIYFPNFGIVGWDMAIDNLGDPVFIEANLWYPGIWMEQQCSGTIFGERTKEAIDFVKNKNYAINYYEY